MKPKSKFFSLHSYFFITLFTIFFVFKSSAKVVQEMDLWYYECAVKLNAQNEILAPLMNVKFVNETLNLPKGINEITIENLKKYSNNELAVAIYKFNEEYKIVKIEKYFKDKVAPHRGSNNPVDLSQFYKIHFSNNENIEEAMQAFNKVLPKALLWEPEKICPLSTPTDPKFLNGNQWHLARTEAAYAWSHNMGESVKIGISDFFHGNVINGSTAYDIQNNITFHQYVSPNASSGAHGTLVAAIAGAESNDSVGVGVAPKASLVAYQAGSYSLILAADDGCDIINLSWKTVNFPALEAAVEYALNSGVVVVAAAGNSSSNPETIYPASYYFPSSGMQVIAVSGTMQNDEFKSGYNYSPSSDIENDPANAFIDIAAPCVNIGGIDYHSNGFYSSTGTSFSAPQVSGLVALLLSIDSTLTVNQIYELVTKSADKVGSYSYNELGWNQYLGSGRLNIRKAVEQLIYLNPDFTISPLCLVAGEKSMLTATQGYSLNEWYINGDYMGMGNSIMFTPDTGLHEFMLVTNNVDTLIKTKRVNSALLTNNQFLCSRLQVCSTSPNFVFTNNSDSTYNIFSWNSTLGNIKETVIEKESGKILSYNKSFGILEDVCTLSSLSSIDTLNRPVLDYTINNNKVELHAIDGERPYMFVSSQDNTVFAESLVEMPQDSMSIYVVDANGCMSEPKTIYPNNIISNLGKDMGELVVEVYPNPAPSGSEIRIGLKNEKPFNYSIYDALGHTVQSSVLVDNKRIKIENINAGVYYLKLSSEAEKKTIPLQIY